MGLDPDSRFRQPRETCRVHGPAMMVDGFCLECGDQPPGWGDSQTPLNYQVLRRLGRFAAAGGLIFAIACVQRPGLPRAFWLLITTLLWLKAVDIGRRQGWTPRVQRHWQAAQAAVAVVMLALILFNRLLG